jgi:hypothetical protein
MRTLTFNLVSFGSLDRDGAVDTYSAAAWKEGPGEYGGEAILIWIWNVTLQGNCREP